MDNTQNIISLCSGYGGLDRGLELAGVKIRVVSYVEIEAFAIANLVAKMETGLLVPAPVWTNLKTFPLERFRGKVHGITAGYPCQPFSVAGQRKGTEDSRHLWPYIRRIYQSIQPNWMFFENVEGHVTLGLSTVISDLEEDGYRVKAGLFTAAEVGAPHRRKRVFILAYSNNAEFEQSGSSVENAECVGRRGWREDWRKVRGSGMSEDKTAGSSASSEVLGNTERQRLAIRHTKLSERSWKIKTPDKSVFAYPNQSRSQGRNCGELQECSVKWPARPGSPQYDWEEPRVVESFLG